MAGGRPERLTARPTETASLRLGWLADGIRAAFIDGAARVATFNDPAPAFIDNTPKETGKHGATVARNATKIPISCAIGKDAAEDFLASLSAVGLKPRKGPLSNGAAAALTTRMFISGTTGF